MDKTVEARLFEEGYAFDFFQAVRLLERLAPQRHPVGETATPGTETVRFRNHVSLSFPPSQIYEVRLPDHDRAPPEMVVTFLGLLGTTGAMPRHYTEQVLRHEREKRGKEAKALRDWYDLFNHRLISLFYRAWTKYRFWTHFERRTHLAEEPDPFTRGLLSLVGMGLPALRNRMRVAVHDGDPRQANVLAKVEDFGLLHYGGLFAQQRRCALGLECLLEDYYRLPVSVEQFQGQWLQLDDNNRSTLGELGKNNELGMNVVVGERVWDVQSRIRIRLGPLANRDFSRFLPDPAPVPEGKTFYELVHLVRFYVGQEFDVDIQFVMKAAEVPECQLPESTADGPRLGWNTWLGSQTFGKDADDAVFEAQEIVWLREGAEVPS